MVVFDDGGLVMRGFWWRDFWWGALDKGFLMGDFWWSAFDEELLLRDFWWGVFDEGFLMMGHFDGGLLKFAITKLLLHNWWGSDQTGKTTTTRRVTVRGYIASLSVSYAHREIFSEFYLFNFIYLFMNQIVTATDCVRLLFQISLWKW